MLYRAYTKANIVPLTAPFYFPAPTFGPSLGWVEWSDYFRFNLISHYHSTQPNAGQKILAGK